MAWIAFILFITIFGINDVWQRSDLFNQDVGLYAMALVAEIAFLTFISTLIHKLPARNLRIFLLVTASMLVAVIYVLQYGSQIIYKKFLDLYDLVIIWTNLDYWQEHADNLIGGVSSYSLLHILFTVFIFLLFFWKVKVKAVMLHLLALFIICSTCVFYLKQNNQLQLLLPTLSFTYHGQAFLRQYKQITKNLDIKSEFPQRDKEAIEKFKPRGKFNLLVILNESLDSNYLSLFGHKDNTTPFQKSFFQQSFLFPHAVSNGTSTDTSLESIFTGLDRSQLDLTHSSLIWQYAKSANLKTFYISSHWLKWNGGMDRLFINPDYIDHLRSPRYAYDNLGIDDFITSKIFAEYLTQSSSDQPFFGVIHFSGTHYPYHVSPEFANFKPYFSSFDPNKVEALENQYKNSILRLDKAVEKVVNALKNKNILNKTIIISTADHGEAMYQHEQFFHGKVFWQEGLRVPMFIHIPKALLDLFSKGELNNLVNNKKHIVSNVDLFPTVLDIYNIPNKKNLSGYSLLKPYPKTWINIIMTEDYMARINSHSGDKYFLDNASGNLRHTQLFTDYEELNAIEIPLKQPMSYNEFEKFTESKNPDLKDKELIHTP